ncbi:hypothetical protein [Microbacterium sp. UCD-TDU]|uniref:hypothetical protein n=1 Tax=Microbacterium sp. UCD-TDU TaxID=1247714 RepID=UPI00036024A9|nr:hypothetical protein [Microbacterium sp. UCD-TDU]EYT57404.1 hypothetical protein D514_0118030 [Microbacterium sp. UCD-TDU]
MHVLVAQGSADLPCTRGKSVEFGTIEPVSPQLVRRARKTRNSAVETVPTMSRLASMCPPQVLQTMFAGAPSGTVQPVSSVTIVPSSALRW